MLSAANLSVLLVVVLVQLWNLSSFTRFFIAIYNMLFAALLILHESQVKANSHSRTESIEYVGYTWFVLVIHCVL